MFLYFVFICLQMSFTLVCFGEGTQKWLIYCPIGQQMLNLETLLLTAKSQPVKKCCPIGQFLLLSNGEKLAVDDIVMVDSFVQWWCILAIW